MESQIMVDHTEVDGNGYLVGRSGNESHPTDELWAQIRSLERRANSRDIEALTLNESGEGARSYLLRLESRELRKQAQRLRKQRADSTVGEPRHSDRLASLRGVPGRPNNGIGDRRRSKQSLTTAEGRSQSQSPAKVVGFK